MPTFTEVSLAVMPPPQVSGSTPAIFNVTAARKLLVIAGISGPNG
jgi:hypothetical protein